MDEIIQAKQAVDLARARLEDAVHSARAQGRSWNEIGTLLGMSRQAAFKRFGRPADPRNGDPMTTRTITGLIEATEATFRLIADGSHDELQARLNPRVREQLTPQLIGDTWVVALGMVGELEGFEGTRVELHDGTPLDADERVIGTVIGATVLRCEEAAGRPRRLRRDRAPSSASSSSPPTTGRCRSERTAPPRPRSDRQRIWLG